MRVKKQETFFFKIVIFNLQAFCNCDFYIEFKIFIVLDSFDPRFHP